MPSPLEVLTAAMNAQRPTNMTSAMARTPEPGYDYRGYIAKYGVPDQSKGQHLTDEFKLPNHITFSTHSKYSNDQTPGGVWDTVDHPDGKKWRYTPSDYVLAQQGTDRLQNYFATREPDSILNIPNGDQ